MAFSSKRNPKVSLDGIAVVITAEFPGDPDKGVLPYTDTIVFPATATLADVIVELPVVRGMTLTRATLQVAKGAPSK